MNLALNITSLSHQMLLQMILAHPTSEDLMILNFLQQLKSIKII